MHKVLVSHLTVFSAYFVVSEQEGCSAWQLVLLHLASVALVWQGISGICCLSLDALLSPVRKGKTSKLRVKKKQLQGYGSENRIAAFFKIIFDSLLLVSPLTSTAALTGWTAAAFSWTGGCFFTEAAGAVSFSGSWANKQTNKWNLDKKKKYPGEWTSHHSLFYTF